MGERVVSEGVEGNTPESSSTAQKIAQHCTIVKRPGYYRFTFREHTAVVLAFVLTDFQFYLMCEALRAGQE